MHRLILWVRHLRSIPSFKASTRMLLLLLMVIGSWGATRALELPEYFDINDKLIHIIVFFGFALLIDLAISRHPFWLWKGVPLLIYGAIIEIMQYFSPDRYFSILDWMADFFGILLYFLIKMFFLRRGAIRSVDSKQ
jgi:VanZ family protein